MKVESKIRVQDLVPFEELNIGDAYEDKEGILCIKVNDGNPDSSYATCLAYVSGEWREDEEHKENMVKPLDASIVIYGYKMKAGGPRW